MTIGKNIAQLRKNSGMTQEQLAAKLQLNGCDITRSAVAKIEVGQRHLYPDEVILIRMILNVSFEDIFSIVSEDDIDAMVESLDQMFHMMSSLMQLKRDLEKAQTKQTVKVATKRPKSDDEVLANFLKSLV